MTEKQIDILKIIKESRMSIPKIAGGSKVPASTIYSWRPPRSSKPSYSDMLKIIRYLEDEGILKKDDKPPTNNESVISVLVDRVAQMLADKNGSSITVESHKIWADAEILRKLSGD